MILSPEFILETFEGGFKLLTLGNAVEFGVAGVIGVFGDEAIVSDSDDFLLTFFFFAAGAKPLNKNKTKLVTNILLSC